MKLKLTTLVKLKNHILRQCYRSKQDHRLLHNLTREEYLIIKSVLTFGGAVEVIGWINVYHIDNTKTTMISRKQADSIINWINCSISIEINPLPSSAYQLPPDCRTSHKLETREDVVKLFKHASQFDRDHEIKKYNTDGSRAAKKTAQYDGAVRALDRIKDAFVTNKRLLCIDVEAYEFKQDKIIEVGYCVWHNGETIYHHYIVKENARYRNRKYVPDNRDHFLFGTTVYLSLKDIMRLVIAEAAKCDFLVGHSVAGDIEWLAKHGFKYDSYYFDTAQIGRCIKDLNKRTPALKDLYEHFGGHAEYMHNGGNDAAYTMSVLESMVEVTPYKELENCNG